MRVVHASSIPASFRKHPHGKGILAETDIKLTRGSKLAAKLLVFRNRLEMRRFWRKALRGKDGLELKCVGAVDPLAYERMRFNPDSHELCVDAKYFCLVALVHGHLLTEVVAHEAVHAAFCYAKRTGCRNVFAKAHEFDEEHIAYPAGLITAAIGQFLHDEGLYPR